MFDIFFIEKVEKISSIKTLKIWKTETQTETQTQTQTENQVIYTLKKSCSVVICESDGYFW